MKCIYLIGFMGSGKTTIGRALGQVLSLPVKDTDLEIEQSVCKAITDIFDSEGESYFRSMEESFLKKLTANNVIITTGGGIVLREENRKWMKNHGRVIFLDTTPAEILNRLANDKTRPLLREDKVTRVSNILEERMPLYTEAADVVIETTGKSVETIVNEIIDRLKVV